MKNPLFTFLVASVLLFSVADVAAGEIFPTGMRWKEVVVEPDVNFDTTTNARLYEIGNEIILNKTKPD